MNAEHATQAIVDLINARVQSPTKAEIAAIIAMAVSTSDGAAPQTSVVSEKTAEWRRVLTDYKAAWAKREHTCRARTRAMTTEEWSALDEELDAITDAPSAKLDATAEAIWAAGAKTWEDVVLFAEIARYEMWDSQDAHPVSDFKLRLATDCGTDERALAQLTHAVLEMGGRRHA